MASAIRVRGSLGRGHGSGVVMRASHSNCSGLPVFTWVAIVRTHSISESHSVPIVFHLPGLAGGANTLFKMG